jgi:hypothetical protein
MGKIADEVIPSSASSAETPPCAAKPDAVFFFLPGGMGINRQAVRRGRRRQGRQALYARLLG